MPQLDPLSRTFEEDFYALHGDNAYDGKTYMRYFEDGAIIAGVGNMATYNEPPSDPISLQHVVIKYWETRKSHADLKFVELKQGLTYNPAQLRAQNFGRLPAPPAEADLETLRGYAEDCRTANKALTEAEAELKRLRDVVDPKLADLDQMLAQRHQKFCDEVRKINV